LKCSGSSFKAPVELGILDNSPVVNEHFGNVKSQREADNYKPQVARGSAGDTWFRQHFIKKECNTIPSEIRSLCLSLIQPQVATAIKVTI